MATVANRRGTRPAEEKRPCEATTMVARLANGGAEVEDGDGAARSSGSVAVCLGWGGMRQLRWLIWISRRWSAKVAMEVEEPSYGGRGTSRTPSPGTHHATAA
ncbi:cell division protein [Sesbania bispinosa]|nr:cell division protein [Sesbania bispinosa]